MGEVQFRETAKTTNIDAGEKRRTVVDSSRTGDQFGTSFGKAEIGGGHTR